MEIVLFYSDGKGAAFHKTSGSDDFGMLWKWSQERAMSQKGFSEATGIAQSSISDWKRKKTNPVSEKILIRIWILAAGIG
jgi:predicted transcriptional regulator